MIRKCQCGKRGGGRDAERVTLGLEEDGEEREEIDEATETLTGGEEKVSSAKLRPEREEKIK